MGRAPAVARQFKHRRLPDFEYIGERAYHLVTVTSGRQPHLAGDVADYVVLALEDAAERSNFKLLCYVVMPDHVHLLACGTEASSNAIRLMQRFKQSTGYRFKREHACVLWQHSFYDHIVRDEEDLPSLARYIQENPVRGGLVSTLEAWQYRGGVWATGAEAPPLHAQEASRV